MFKPAWMNSQTNEGKCSYNDREFFRERGFFRWDITTDHTDAAMVIRLLRLVMQGLVTALVMACLLSSWFYCSFSGFGGCRDVDLVMEDQVRAADSGKEKLGPRAEFSHFTYLYLTLPFRVDQRHEHLDQHLFNTYKPWQCCPCTGKSVSRYPSPANSNASLLLRKTS